uniref:Dual OB-containing domain-containing protein n=1 Tax=Clytia hemisphaerica TaxID=252671 RepID=A0A7M5UXT8_9CNID
RFYKSNMALIKCTNCDSTSFLSLSDLQNHLDEGDDTNSIMLEQLNTNIKGFYWEGVHSLTDEDYPGSCENCDEEMLQLHFQVEGTGVDDWIRPVNLCSLDEENHSQSKRFDGFSDFKIITSKGISQERNSNDDNINLLIIAKTRMNKGFCYIGLDNENGEFFRPIYRQSPKKCCWEDEFVIGQYYDFTLNVDVERITKFPHQNEDLTVKNSPEEDYSRANINLFGTLEPYSKNDLQLLFGGLAEVTQSTRKVWVEEGTVCPSFEVFKCYGRDLQFISSDTKLRIQTDVQDFILSWTSSDYIEDEVLTRNHEIEVLVLIGLGRGFRKGRENWPRKRCYALALGLYFRT